MLNQVRSDQSLPCLEPTLVQDSLQGCADDILHHPFIKNNPMITGRHLAQKSVPSRVITIAEPATDIAEPLHPRSAKLAHPLRLPNTPQASSRPTTKSISHVPLQDVSNTVHRPLASRANVLVVERGHAHEPFALPHRRPPTSAYPPSPPMTALETSPKLEMVAKEDYRAPIRSRRTSRNITPQNGVSALVALGDRTEGTSLSAKGLPPRVFKTGGGSFTVQANGSLLVDLRESDRRTGGKGNEVFLIEGDGSKVRFFTLLASS